MKFVFDENVHHGLFSFLIKLGHDVKLSPKSVTNSEVFNLAIMEERILITRDAHFSNSSLYPPSKNFGIWLLRIPPRDLEAQKKSILNLLSQFARAEEFEGKVVILSPEKFEFMK